MEILGVGLPELIFILLLVLVIFGPKDLEKAGKMAGRAIFRFLNSDTWKAIRQVGKLPAELVRQAGLDELRDSLDAGKKAPSPTIGTPAGPAPAAGPTAAAAEPRGGTSQPSAPAPAEAEHRLRPPDESKG
jgi:Sec-independent protein translocase protein TatA